MRKYIVLMLIMAVAMMALAACGGGGEADTGETAGEVASVGNAANGEDLYSSAVIGPNSAPGCITCHSLEEGVVIVGPSHAGLAARAGTYVAGMSDVEYLRESIVEPNAHLVEGFGADIMYQNYGADLTEEQINDLVAYMLTLN